MEQQFIKNNYNNNLHNFDKITHYVNNNLLSTNINQSFNFINTLDNQKNTRVWNINKEFNNKQLKK